MIEIATVIALASLYVSLRVAWDTRFKPTKVVAFFPSLTVWKFSRKDEEKTETLAIPCVVLTNVGAQAAVIEDIRLGFVPNDGAPYWTYPDLSVPLKAMEQPGEFLGESSSVDDYGRMVLGKPFSGIVLTSGGVASLNYHFSGPLENRPAILGTVGVELQIWLRGSRRWKRVASDKFTFSEDPFVPPMKVEKTTTSVTVVPSESRRNRRGS